MALTIGRSRLAIPAIVPYFTFFPHLPPELRNKIWKLASWVGRDLKLDFIDSTTTTAVSSGNSNFIVPAVLRTSTEARNEALKHYTLVFEKTALNGVVGYLWPRNGLGNGLRGVYVNFSVDRFYHSRMGDYNYFLYHDCAINDYNFDAHTLRHIQHLVFRIDLTQPSHFYYLDYLFTSGKLADLTVSISSWEPEFKSTEPVLLHDQLEKGGNALRNKIHRDMAILQLPKIPIHIRWSYTDRFELVPCSDLSSVKRLGEMGTKVDIDGMGA
jgi:2EXR family